MGNGATYHTRSWLLWLAAAGLAASLTRNPLYLALIALAARAVDEAAAVGRQGEDSNRPPAIGGGLLRLALLMTAFSALFNALFAHSGATVLFQLPADWPAIGGRITLESLVFGASSGLVIVTLLLVAGTFNLVADTYSMLRAIPPALAQAGLITAVGLAYVPQTITRVGEIREAQVLRGTRLRGTRAILPMAVPLLAGGLERALALAEAMESRGFSGRGLAADTAPALRRLLRGGLLFGTAAVTLGAFLMLYFRQNPWPGGALLTTGLLSLAAVFRHIGRLSRHTRYRREVWRSRDSLVSAVIVLCLLLIVGGRLAWPAAWLYSPYPALTWPPFDALTGLTLTMLSTPAVLLLAEPYLSLVRKREA